MYFIFIFIYKSSISLDNNIVILDEAHNIEDVCRGAASFQVTENQINRVKDDLEGLSMYNIWIN